jgi:NADPH:quinone reductase-like Zn-dependent oxidoreductase
VDPGSSRRPGVRPPYDGNHFNLTLPTRSVNGTPKKSSPTTDAFRFRHRDRADIRLAHCSREVRGPASGRDSFSFSGRFGGTRAAVVRSYENPPEYGEFEDPTPKGNETSVDVVAVAETQYARARAAGLPWAPGRPPPFIAGTDGIGRTRSGARVYFSGPRFPYGSLAEKAVIASDSLVPVPGQIDDATAAAAPNLGLSCWIPLTRLAPIRPGESVLVNGGTGNAGRMAIQVAKHLGAKRVVATGRDEKQLRKLRELGADTTLSLRGPPAELREAIRREARESRIGVVLDYLWGPPAETLVHALGGPDAPRGTDRIRFVSVGELAGPVVALQGAVLRSSGVEILGTGYGAVKEADTRAATEEFFDALVRGGFRIDTETHPLSQIEGLWGKTSAEKRAVYTIA